MSSFHELLGRLNRKRSNLLRLLLTLAVLAGLPAAAYLIHRRMGAVGWKPAPAPAAVAATLVPSPQLREIVSAFARNQTITDALGKNGIPARLIAEIVASAKPVYNLARVTAGKYYTLALTPEGSFHDLRYPIDEDRYLTVYRHEDHFVSVVKPFSYETRLETVTGEIEDSLYASMTNLGEQDKLADLFADIFGWEIDFYTEIQPGDTFRVLVEKRYLNGSFKNYGSILAASITNQDRLHTGFRFKDEKGKAAYYDANGKALKKSFLKSPLKFARISSRFSYSRMHPILKIVRPHLGVDYAAPVGTPVQAVGAGVVVATGQNAGSGKMIKLRHAGGYETMYMHLSRIAVRTGAHVEQSQVIGLVGATGLATGPHLDFRVYFHGKPINPGKVIFPPNPPITQDHIAEFASVRDRLRVQLDRTADFANDSPRVAPAIDPVAANR
jgi:murein DD-endopeptidase MepM/ murein hydrolase activator NlpD